MNNDQNNRTNRDQQRGAEQSAAGNREHANSGPMTQPGVDVPAGKQQASRREGAGRAGDPAKPEQRSPKQENL